MLGKFDRITFDKAILGGKACIRNMRIPVSLIINLVAHGKQFNEIIEEYPVLEKEDIQQALEYASWLAKEQVIEIEVMQGTI
jgi:uncharacterized protein (DUF433 family)